MKKSAKLTRRNLLKTFIGHRRGGIGANDRTVNGVRSKRPE